MAVTKETKKDTTAQVNAVEKKEAAPAAPAVKAEPAKAEAKKEEKPAAKKPAAKKTTAKKPAAKKPAAKKAAEPEKVPAAVKKANVFLQFSQREEIKQEDLIIRIIDKWCAEENKKPTSIKEFNVYIKPEDNAAYYVINGQGSSIGL